MASTSEAVRVVDVPEQSRYEARLGEQVAGHARYLDRDGRRIFTHTEVDPSIEGRGVGSALARGALDDVRARGLRMTSRCPFISAYLARHPEYADLEVDPGRAAR